MPRLPKRVPKTRLSLEMPNPVRENLLELRDRTNAQSLAEVIRRALSVYDFVVRETKDGGSIVVRRANGDEREIHFLL